MLDLITTHDTSATDAEINAVMEAQADDLARLNRARDFDALIVAFVKRGYRIGERAAQSVWLRNEEARSGVEVWWNDTECAHEILLNVGAEEIQGWNYDWDNAAETVAALLRDYPNL